MTGLVLEIQLGQLGKITLRRSYFNETVADKQRRDTKTFQSKRTISQLPSAFLQNFFLLLFFCSSKISTFFGFLRKQLLKICLKYLVVTASDRDE